MFSPLPGISKAACFLAFLVITTFPVQAFAGGENSGYQYSFRIEPKDQTAFEALLWVPPGSERIRGVLIGEREYIANDPAIRQAAADEHLAIILLRPHFDKVFTYWENRSEEILQETLDVVAKGSGYHDIAHAPLFPFGHSVSSVYSSRVGYWNPSRCFGILAFKGALVEPHSPDATVVGVPILIITGQFEEFGPGPSGVLRDWEDRETGWRVSRDRYLAMRAKDERNLLCFAVDGGSTHMAWSPRNGELTAAFLRSAAQIRIPDWSPDVTEPVVCRDVDPATGWLVSAAVNDPSRMRSAPYAQWKGDRAGAWWLANEDLVKAWKAFHEGRFAKRTQYVAFKDPKTGKTLRPRNDMRLVLQPHWTGADRFQVAGEFLMEVRDKYPTPEPPLGHAEGPIRFTLHRTGDIEQTGPDEFRVVTHGADAAEGHVLAFHEGDETFRPAEQPAFVKIPLLKEGAPNTIDFPQPPDLLAGGDPVPLSATSSSGLPVTYSVDYGPARIESGTLVPLALPKRAKGPMEVKITAYQWGSATAPLFQTAQPVTRQLKIRP